MEKINLPTTTGKRIYVIVPGAGVNLSAKLNSNRVLLSRP